ncbi:hypothetical protein BSKO_08243 [Bryopsis sp. KO-2023]|nr:hypothetical protein BSKO_08243 [Bryopsis sp. KO-2023]
MLAFVRALGPLGAPVECGVLRCLGVSSRDDWGLPVLRLPATEGASLGYAGFATSQPTNATSTQPALSPQAELYRWPRYNPEPPPDNDDETASVGDLCRKLRMLVKSTGPSHDRRLDSVAKWITLHVDELDVYAISNVYFSCKIGGYLNKKLLRGLVKRVVGDDLFDEFDAIQTGMTIQSLGVLSRFQASVDGASLGNDTESMCVLLASQVVEKEGLNEQVLANVVHGMGNLFRRGKGHSINPAVEDCMDGISEEVCKPERLSQYTDQALANILYGWGVMGWKKSDKLRALCGEMLNGGRLKNFREQELCNTIYALGLLNFDEENVLVSLAVEAVGPHRLRKFREKELCMVVHGLSQCVQSVDASLKRLLVPVTRKLTQEIKGKERMRAYNTTDLAMLVSSLGILETEDDEVISMLISRFVALSRNSYVYKEEFTQVLQACVRFDYRHKPFLNLVDDALDGDRIDLNSSFAITLVLWCLYKLKSLRTPVFMKMCRKLIQLRRRGEEMSVESCVQLSQVVAHIGTLKGKKVLDEDLHSLFDQAMSRQKSDSTSFRDMLLQATRAE